MSEVCQQLVQKLYTTHLFLFTASGCMFQGCLKLGTRNVSDYRSGWQTTQLRALSDFILVPFPVHTFGCTGKSFYCIIICNCRLLMLFLNIIF
jgi:hypothetical protein